MNRIISQETWERCLMLAKDIRMQYEESWEIIKELESAKIEKKRFSKCYASGFPRPPKTKNYDTYKSFCYKKIGSLVSRKVPGKRLTNT